MNPEVPPGSETAVPPAGRGWRVLHRFEDYMVVACLAAMVLLPLAESVLRKVFHTGISGSTTLVQHLVLFVGMLGGAVAARQGRLLALSTVTSFLHGRWRSVATVLSSGVAAAIAFYLCLASSQYVLSKRGSGEIFVYGFPIWIVLLVLPIGFGLVTWRLVWRTGGSWRPRLATGLLTVVLAALVAQTAIPASQLVVPALIALFIATVLGAPVFATLGGAALILFWGGGQPIAMVSIDHYRLTTDATLPTIPLFTLAGYFLAEGGASRRLVRVFQTLVGQLRGGPAIVTALVCALFTSFTGASGVTILALGGLLMPVLLAARYSEQNALGLLTGAGSLGLLFPPCLPLILYAVVATTIGTEITIGRMFLGGLLPGLLLVLLTAAWGILCGPALPASERQFHPGEAARALWEAKWELLLPVVALVALFGGFATAVEAAALTALYAFAVEAFVYRDLKLGRDVPRAMTECGLLVGGVLLILGVAMGFTDYLFNAEVPEKLVFWAKDHIHSRWVFLLALNGFLLIVGCLMDVFSAIVVVAPLVIPIGNEFGIDPVHLGIIFLANLELGFLTPPVGMNLFLASYRFHKPMPVVIRSVLPMLGVLLLGVLLITYLPPLTTWLPRLAR